jgi:diaminohydroxyphosphoribosylaminopyrimidine deaminase / 5-amino-6-(5-phosphoribosylamino)uracil reductase
VDTARHGIYMQRALALAERGWGRVSPNPLVGAVIVYGDQVVGEGWHEGPGSPHAEVVALRDAGEGARGSTLYVTLEPCDHTGRTGPCTEAIIEAGVARVVAGATDPNPVVDGSGFARLRSAGVEVATGVLGDEARRLNVAFERHVRTGRPFVIVKGAASLDGKTATIAGVSKWITSRDARDDAQRLRAWADAIVVGARTAIEDEPALTVRVPAWADARPPIRVVVDTAGRVPAGGAMFDGSAPTLVATTEHAPDARVSSWQAAGAEVVVLGQDIAGGVSLEGLLDALGKRDVQGLVVEGGATLAWSFVRDALVDRVVVYLAPMVLGGASAPGIVMGGGFTGLDESLPLEITAVERVGPDLKVEADVQRHR